MSANDGVVSSLVVKWHYGIGYTVDVQTEVVEEALRHQMVFYAKRLQDALNEEDVKG